MDPTLIAEVVDRAPDGVLLIDAGGRIAFANRQTEALFGFTPEELLGKTIELLVPERLRSRHIQHQATFHARPSTRAMGSGLELTALRKDGSELPVEISLSPLPTSDGMYVTAVVRDVSERKRLEDERQRLRSEAELQADRERIARDLHDGVMQALYGVGLNLMYLKAGEPEVQAGVEEAVQALGGVIADIRAFVMNLPVERAHDEMAGELRGLVEDMRMSSALEVTVDVEAELPELDEDRRSAILQIAREALANARRHARATRVRLSLVKHGMGVLLEVHDNGAGFEPTADVGRDHMGLRNMQTRAEQFGAEFEIRSAPGAGTTIQLVMPAEG